MVTRGLEVAHELTFAKMRLGQLLNYANCQLLNYANCSTMNRQVANYRTTGLAMYEEWMESLACLV